MIVSRADAKKLLSIVHFQGLSRLLSESETRRSTDHIQFLPFTIMIESFKIVESFRLLDFLW